jgi:hypothetical protein
MKLRSEFIKISLATSFFWSIISASFAIPKEIELTANNYSCPNKIEELATQMLQDLPNYTNRVMQRSRSIVEDKKLINQRYVIVAGKAEFQPLTLNNSEYTPETTDSSQQVFFTTLEREYRRDRVLETQNYHWLFLARTKNDWQVVMMYSRFGTGSNIVAMPPQDTTNGAVATAVSLWLKDCRAGVVRS